MAIRSRVQLRKDAEHKRQSEITDKAVRKAEKNHLVKHPINRYRRLRDDTIALGIMALITLLLLI